MTVCSLVRCVYVGLGNEAKTVNMDVATERGI